MRKQKASRSELAKFRSRYEVIDEIIDEAIERLSGASAEERVAATRYFLTRWQLTTAEGAELIHFLIAQWEFAEADLRARARVAHEEREINRLKLAGVL